MTPQQPGAPSEPGTIREQADGAEGEARMAMPGIQALIGFEMIAVCGERYGDFDAVERWTNFGTLALVTLAIVLFVAPGGYQRLLHAGSSFFAWATVFLAAAIGSELYLVVRIATEEHWFGPILAVATCAMFAYFWFMMPLRKRRNA
jgi:hypothetical protein